MKTYIFDRKDIPLHLRYILRGTQFIVEAFATHNDHGEEYANVSDLNRLLSGEVTKIKVRGILGDRLCEGLGDLLFDYIGASILDLDRTPPETGSRRKFGYGEDVDYSTWHITWKPWELFAPYNFYEMNHEAKVSSSRAPGRFKYRSIIGEMYMPFAGSTVHDEDNTFLFRDPEFGCSFVGFDTDKLIPKTLYDIQHHIDFDPFPRITVEAPENCGADGCTVTIRGTFHGEPLKRDVTLYLKTDCGYLSHTKLLMHNGEATVRFIPLGLAENETVTIKAGFKHFSNLARCRITVGA